MDDNELKMLLIQWREWSRSSNESLGYNSKSIEYTLMKEGMVIKATGSNVSENIECELLDHAIALMPQKLKKIIKLKYLFHWLNKDAAKTLGMSVPSYKDHVIRSRMWLCGKLTK